VVLRERVSRSLDHASGIIALSESTRRDTLAVNPTTDARTRVIYGAGNYPTPDDAAAAAGDKEALAALGIREAYVLYVGDFNPRKNVPYLIQSFAAMKAQGVQAQLVLAGESRGQQQSLTEVASVHKLLARDVVFAGRVSDATLKILYRNARVFSLFSLMEGFTLVTLEAMSYGVPVVATRTSSIEEGTGDAAELVPLAEPALAAAALRRVFVDERRRSDMIRLGYARSAQFTWDKAAAATLDLYNDARRHAEVVQDHPEADRLPKRLHIS
jgi:glycosyltransferase involved in cell wall biosynthesis